ncbi:hypothetical protein PAMC26577_21705 [Caballeronia sordidicola]|uniref:Uncharacterized protein n=1 Tax=Caballeronia sordidicola TaxID=196367 RepID=A0A242MLI2_CABSO|nr:hypothetical protein PAMC26577_21705 [Caballeronia sordidicola]
MTRLPFRSENTKATLAQHDSDAGEPSWRFYEEVFEREVVYLKLKGVDVEVSSTAQGNEVTIRLPVKTAEQLGLHTNVRPKLWTVACDPDKQ